jgi:integrase
MSKSYQSFEEFMKEHRLVREKHLKYYVDWVERFSKHCGNRLQNISRKAISTYLDNISRWQNVQDWQIRQADDAIAIFTKNYLKHVHNFDMVEHCRQHDIPVKPGPESWQQLAVETKEAIRIRQYSFSTEKTYIGWIKRFGEYLKHKAPIQVDSGDVKNYMTYLALERNVAPSTQNQSFNSVLFLFKHVLYRDLSEMQDTPRPKRTRNIPVVLSLDEVKNIFKHFDDEYKLIYQLLYGTGLRISECLELRYGDLNFDKGTILVKSGKGFKDRTTLLPQPLKEQLHKQLAVVKERYNQDIEEGYGCVGFPNAILRKYPNAHKALEWQWLFPKETRCKDPRTDVIKKRYANVNSPVSGLLD